MIDLQEEIKKREINQYNAMVFSLLASMFEMGLVNQGIVNVLGRRTAGYLKKFYDSKKVVFDLDEKTWSEKFTLLFDFFNEELNIVKEYKIDVSPDAVLLGIKSKYCRICPKGLGGIELKGTLCIVPHLILYLINSYMPENQKFGIRRYHPPIQKEAGTCTITYSSFDLEKETLFFYS